MVNIKHSKSIIFVSKVVAIVLIFHGHQEVTETYFMCPEVRFNSPYPSCTQLLLTGVLLVLFIRLDNIQICKTNGVQ